MIGIHAPEEHLRRLKSVLDGLEGLPAGAPRQGAHLELLVVFWQGGASAGLSRHADGFVPVLAIVSDLEEAAAAVASGVSDVVMNDAGDDETRLRASLLIRHGRGRACSAPILERILRAELSRSDRDGVEISLIQIRPGSCEIAGFVLAETLAGNVRASDHAGVTSDGAVIVVLPGTPLEHAAGVARRLRNRMGDEMGASVSMRVAGGRIGHMTPPEVVRLLSRAPEIP
ncbi:hypothetical protein GX411_03165 [Candidatus Fermentibacteria bacterium]|nr:hypothetical protein [Candidatus Fermentibacteria bacterium]